MLPDPHTPTLVELVMPDLPMDPDLPLLFWQEQAKPFEAYIGPSQASHVADASPLMQAVDALRPHVVAALLLDADVLDELKRQATTSSDETALQMALFATRDLTYDFDEQRHVLMLNPGASEAQELIVAMLLAAGAVPTVEDYQALGSTGNPRLIERFTSSGPAVNWVVSPIPRDTALHQAVSQKWSTNNVMLDRLLHHSLNINALGYEDQTPLHHAIVTGHAPNVQWLINHGATLKDGTLDDSLRIAAYKSEGQGWSHLVPILVQAGGDPNVSLPNGETLLVQVAMDHRFHMAHALIESGALLDPTTTRRLMDSAHAALADPNADSKEHVLDPRIFLNYVEGLVLNRMTTYAPTLETPRRRL